MRHLVDLISRFRRDESGAFAMIFAMMAIVLVATAGATVDFTSMQQARTKAQVALDAAALALQPRIYDTDAGVIQTDAQALVQNRLSDTSVSWQKCLSENQPSNELPCVLVQRPTPDTTNGTLELDAELQVPMNFVSLIGFDKLTVQMQSAATRQKLNLEVAMVLDNSGSMDYTMGYNSNIGGTSRMDTLQQAAACATNILFYGVSSCDATVPNGTTPDPNVKMGVVPFTEAVNVGTSNATASWLDRTGAAKVTDENFDNDDDDNNPTGKSSLDTVSSVDTFAGPVDRINLFSEMKDHSGNTMSWGGCVEARKAPYDTNDTAPDSSNPDTLFTPYFAPDEPDSSTSGPFYNNYISDTPSNCPAAPQVVWKQVKTKCSYAASGSSAASNYNKSCSGTTTNTYIETDWGGAVSTVTSMPAYIHDNPQPSSSSKDVYSSSGSGSNKITNERDSTYIYPFSQRELQERMCKYNGAKLTGNVSISNVFGPNGDCPINAPILPLTATPSDVISAIDAMTPNGGTNITEGAAWGFRVLSPTAPFTEGLPYGEDTSKVMILMTDGANTIYPGSNMNDDTYYSAYGYPWNERLLSPVNNNATTLETEMNNRLSTVCTNAKTAGVTIYTIGIDVKDSVPNNSAASAANKTLLTDCATDSSKAYFPDTASELTGAFEKIANELEAWRLGK